MPILTINGQSHGVPAGSLLSDSLPRGCGVELPCGGLGRCGKCRVSVRGLLTPPDAQERAHLTPGELDAGVRLACRARVLGDCSVTVGTEHHEVVCTAGAAPTVGGQYLFQEYGAAVDLGTTTLAARIYGKEGLLAEGGATNPQTRYGADVISRVGHALTGGASELAACIRGGISELLTDLCMHAGILPRQLDALVITGNTAMLYLLTGADPDCLSHAPFTADRLFGETLRGEELDLPCLNAAVYLPRCVSAFVGADFVTAALCTGLCTGEKSRLLADVGTNGELGLWHKGELLCCSTAAGPAFEGAGLSMGMRGRAGAIDHVWLENGFLHTHVLGEATPTGICGSGVVDALACLLELGALDETGRLDREPAVLALPVCLTQQDVRMVQLAKSAIHAGLSVLLQTEGLSAGEVERLDVAGGFGSYLDIKNAGRIGLLPEELLPRVRVVGNAALAGAAMLLTDRGLLAQAETLAQSGKTVDLSRSAAFLTAYTEGMLFPEEND